MQIDTSFKKNPEMQIKTSFKKNPKSKRISPRSDSLLTVNICKTKNKYTFKIYWHRVNMALPRGRNKSIAGKNRTEARLSCSFSQVNKGHLLCGPSNPMPYKANTVVIPGS